MAAKPIEWENLSAAERVALAKAGEKSPLHFTALWFNITQGDSFRTNWHHHYFNYAAQKMLSGEIQNAVINIPPGGTKTEFFSIHLPVYAMTQFDRVRILNTSYSKDLVNENSTRSRDLVKSSEFHEMYGLSIGKDKVDDWTVEKNEKRVHQLFSRASGGQITGVRGGYMADSYSGHIQADDWDKMDDLFSEAKRKKSHTRLVNTLRSRRANSKTPFLAIQQRGHIDDSTAFLMSGGMGFDIDLHISIPALVNEEYISTLPPEIAERCRRDVCESGQVDGYWSYWPAKEDVKDLLRLKQAHVYTFNSQYMQEPELLDGGIFKADDFIFYGDVGEGADLPTPERFEYRFITADTAQKTNEWNDWTVLTEWGVFENKIYRLSYCRKRMEATELRKTFEAFVNSAHAKNSELGTLRAAYVEDKASGTGLIQEVSNRLKVPVKAVQRNRDKLTRALDVQGLHAEKRVVLPSGDKDNADFISEVASFTPDDSHKHDDITDTMVDGLDIAFIGKQAPTEISFSFFQ